MQSYLIIILGFLLSHSALAVITVEVAPLDILPRDQTLSSVEIPVKITGITQPKETADLHLLALRVIVPTHNANFQIPFDENGTEADKERVDLGLRIGNAQIQQEDDSSYKVEGTLVLSSKTADALKTAINASTDRKSLQIKLKYQAEEEHSEVTYTLSTNSTIPFEAPVFTNVGGGHFKLIAQWTHQAEILYSNNTRRAPSSVTIFVHQADQGIITIPARVFDGASDSSEVSCTFNTNAVDGESCVACDSEDTEKVYIDLSKLTSTVKRSSYASSTGSGSVSNLEVKDAQGNKIRYISFLAYSPEGAKRSACKRTEIYETLTLMEYLGNGAKTTRGDPSCFIATTVYGSFDHPRVKTFRWFRDAYLMQTLVGRGFISFYYKVGPYLASIVEKVPGLKPASKWTLDGLATMIEALDQ